jgi:pyruvate dehydrogenase E1 component
LREFFEVNSSNIVLAALNALADDGKLDRETVQTAVAALDIDPDKPNPVSV